MEITHYLSILWRRKWVVVGALAALLIVIAIGHASATPIYVSSATLRVAASMGGAQTPTYYTYNEQLMNTYVQLASSRPILADLAERLNSSGLPDLRAEVIPNTELIRITAESSDPQLAALAGNTLAQILIEQSDQLYAGGARSSTEILAGQVEEAKSELDATRKEYERLIVQTPAAPDKIALSSQLLTEKQKTYETLLRQYEQAQYKEAVEASMITVVEPAVAAATPSRPRVTLDYSLGVGLGLLAGLVLAFVLENMDSRLHVTREIEAAAHAPTLAKFPRAGRSHLRLSGNGYSPLAESVRYLAMQIQWMNQKTPRKILLVTGAEAGQGVSTAVANLADALVEQGKLVALVDCNLRHPKLHELFGLSNETGLAEVLSGLDVKEALQTSPDGRLTVLTSGGVPGAPSHAFDPARIESLLQSLRQQFDYILLDTPAITVADVTAFAPHADGLILVARRSHVRRGAVEAAGEFLSRFEGKFLGLVVNEAEGQAAHSYA